MINLLFAIIIVALIYNLLCPTDYMRSIDNFAITGTNLDTCALYDGNIANCKNIGGDSCVYNMATDECLSVFEDVYISTNPYFDWNYWYLYNNYFPFFYNGGYYYLDSRAHQRYPDKYGHINSGIRSRNGHTLFGSRKPSLTHYDKIGKNLFNQRQNLSGRRSHISSGWNSNYGGGRIIKGGLHSTSNGGGGYGHNSGFGRSHTSGSRNIRSGNTSGSHGRGSGFGGGGRHR